MTKIFFDIAISLEGFLAGNNRSPKNPLGDGGEELHKWMTGQKAFLELHGQKGGESSNKENSLIEEMFERTGANIMGRRMFDEGEANWPENAPFHTPVFILTNKPREPWKKQGGTTFYFITDGLESALQKAKDAAGEKDVRISGGANVIQQFLNGGFVDEFTIHYAPVFLGGGLPLFGNLEKNSLNVEIVEAINLPRATHIKYKMGKKKLKETSID